MHERGLTLLELLVTLTIIGIAVSAVALSIKSTSGHEFDVELERLAALFEMAQDEARLSARAVVWVADARGYRFEHIQSDENRPLPAALALARPWPLKLTAVEPSRIVLGQEPVMNPVILNLSTASRQIRLQVDALGRLEKWQ